MNKNIEQVRNLFTDGILVIRLAVKKLPSAKLFVILLVSVMFAGIFSLSPAISTLMNDVVVRSTGRIATATTAPLAYKSEIRGVFIDGLLTLYPHDWDVIAETLKSYNINALFLGFMFFGGANWEELDLAIQSCHARDIEVHLLMNFFFVGPEEYPELHVVDHNGNVYPYWICPTKQGTRDIIKAQVEEAARNYDIDGFMFDYVRYVLADMCYCDECKAKFQAWLGEGPITDWTSFYPEGSRYNEFMEWRTIPVTEMVRDVREWMLAIKPDLEFSAAVFTLFSDAPTYWRYYIGQDTADFIGKDYLDFVAPMMYTTSLSDLQDYIETDWNYMTGGPEGKIPLVCFLTTGIETAIDPNIFKQEVDLLRSLGAGGWIIWRYGGPGVEGAEGTLFDITQYLPLIDLPDAFTLNNIEVSPRETEATITWTTDLPATSKVEYNTSPLFPAYYKYWSATNSYYWDIDHVPGTIVENNTSIMYHNVTLTALMPGTNYYFRVQSEDSRGIATSKVYTFTTSGVIP